MDQWLVENKASDYVLGLFPKPRCGNGPEDVARTKGLYFLPIGTLLTWLHRSESISVYGEE